MNAQYEKHIPVLLDEVVEGLRVKEGGRYIDATIGAAGHTKQIIALGGSVLGIDQDKEILNYVREHFKHPRLTLVRSNFQHIYQLAEEAGWIGVEGILLDLGVSSYQLDNPERGFSFMHDGPLDMRMDTQLEVTAEDIVNQATEDELFRVLTKYSQERQARKIARAICTFKKQERITRTNQLADIVSQAVPDRHSRIHPATKTFQAIRMLVNQELNKLETVLPQCLDLLVTGGRLCVISFHEGEDRIVKQFFQASEKQQTVQIINKKPIMAQPKELANNSRSRSAKLRIVEKI